MTNDEALDLLGRLHLAAVEGYEDHGIEERIARVSTDLKTYIEETAAELERVRAGFRAMTAEFAGDECPCDADELRGEQMKEFGCPEDACDDEDTDCERGAYECWERLFIERAAAR